MKDPIVLGSVAGSIGGAIGLIFSHSLFLLGIPPISSVHLAATMVVMDITNLTTGGVIWSLVTHFVVASTYGVLITYFLLKTGKDYWLLKGMLTGAFFCLIAHSYLIPLMRTEPQVHSLIFNAPSFGTMITAHSIIGVVAVFIVVRYS